jgi:hypothetical protein
VRKLKFIFSILIIIGIFFPIFHWLQFNTDFFAGWDSYYHVKMAKIINIIGIVHKFPWLRYTFLNKKYVDSHFLFHIILIPFLKLGIFYGPKLAIIIFQTLAFLIFYLLLKSNKIPFSFLWMVSLLILPKDFFYRMNLIRVSSLSLFLLLLSLYFLFKKKNILLGILLYIYTLTYIGFIIFLPILFIYVLFKSIEEKKFALSPLLFSLIGIGLGLLSHPYFPEIFNYLYINIFKSGIAPKIPVGTEWYPYNISYFLNISFFTLLFYLIAIIFVLFQKRKLDTKGKTIFVSSLMFLILTLISRRFIEYWPIFAILSSAFVTAPYLKKISEEKKYQDLKFAVLPLIVFYLFILGERNLTQAKADISPTIDVNLARDAIIYVRNNSEAGDIIFTDDWDIFTYYFFFNTKNYYIVGLDPTFMYVYNRELYKKYVCLTRGSKTVEVAGIQIDAKKYGNLKSIPDDFHARWIIVDNEHKEFLNNLRKSPLFILTYRNKFYNVFMVKM